MSQVTIHGVKIDTRHFIGGSRVASTTTYKNFSPIDNTPLGDIHRGGAD